MLLSQKFKLSNLASYHRTIDDLKKIVDSIKEECKQRQAKGLEPNQMFVIWDKMENGQFEKEIIADDRS